MLLNELLSRWRTCLLDSAPLLASSIVPAILRSPPPLTYADDISPPALGGPARFDLLGRSKGFTLVLRNLLLSSHLPVARAALLLIAQLFGRQHTLLQHIGELQVLEGWKAYRRTTYYWLLTTYYWLLTTGYLLLTTYYRCSKAGRRRTTFCSSACRSPRCLHSSNSTSCGGS